MVSLVGVLLAQVITLPSGQTVDVYEIGHIARLIQIGLLFGIVFWLIGITWSGVQWVSAKKNKAKRTRARRRIIWSLVGLVTTFLITLIVTFITITFSPAVDY